MDYAKLSPRQVAVVVLRGGAGTDTCMVVLCKEHGRKLASLAHKAYGFRERMVKHGGLLVRSVLSKTGTLVISLTSWM